MAREIFKIGDKVRCIEDHIDKELYNLNLRRAYRIIDVRYELDVRVAGNGTRETTWWDARRFEKVKPNRR